MKQNQNGRSMIEMLGVLSIIGVLSVGGIAGYSKAMQKHKINQAINQIAVLSQNISNTYLSQKNYSGIECNGNNDDSGCIIIKKAALAPAEMYQNPDAPNLIYNPWGNEVNIWLADKIGADGEYNDNSDAKAFIIYFQTVTDDMCIELMSHDWSNLGNIIAIGGNPGDEVYKAYFGCQGSRRGENGESPVACLGGSILPIPMDINSAIEACSTGDLALKFY